MVQLLCAFLVLIGVIELHFNAEAKACNKLPVNERGLFWNFYCEECCFAR